VYKVVDVLMAAGDVLHNCVRWRITGLRAGLLLLMSPTIKKKLLQRRSFSSRNISIAEYKPLTKLPDVVYDLRRIKSDSDFGFVKC
jgi:hypothetical protein